MFMTIPSKKPTAVQTPIETFTGDGTIQSKAGGMIVINAPSATTVVIRLPVLADIEDWSVYDIFSYSAAGGDAQIMKSVTDGGSTLTTLDSGSGRRNWKKWLVVDGKVSELGDATPL